MLYSAFELAEHLKVWNVGEMLAVLTPEDLMHWRRYFKIKERLTREAELAARAAEGVESRVRKGRR